MNDDQAEYEEIAERYKAARKEAYEIAEKQLAEEFERRGLRDAAEQVRRGKHAKPKRRWGWRKEGEA